MRVLVAEDDTDEAQLYKIALESQGHSVVNALDGREALNFYKSAVAEKIHYDVVMLDNFMPYMVGLEVAKQILDINPSQRIIMASVFIKDSLKESIERLNQVIEVIQKPFEPDLLIDVIEDVSMIHKLHELNDAVKAGASFDQIVEQLKALQKHGTV